MKKLMALCILGLAVLIVANNETFARPAETGDRKCTDGKDNDGDGLIDADDPGCQNIVYTAERAVGVLSFPAVNVILNGTESDLIPVSGTADLEFFRPGVPDIHTFMNPFLDACNILADEANELACNAWDAVIESCDHLVDTGRDGASVPHFKVAADNLRFSKIGGVRITYGGIDVLETYSVINFQPDGELFMGLNLSLIGDCFDGCTDNFIPTVSEPPSEEFELTHFWLTGHTVAKGKKGHCNKDGHEGDLAVPDNSEDDLLSNLIITASCGSGDPPNCTAP